MKRVIFILAIILISSCCENQCEVQGLRCPAEVTYAVQYGRDSVITHKDTVDIVTNDNFIRVTNNYGVNYLTVAYQGSRAVYDIKNLFASPYPITLMSTKYLK